MNIPHITREGPQELMSVFDIIRRRRSIGKMTTQQPTREQVARLLEAATHAPNHHKVEPWKFFVLAGKVRAELGAVMAESLAARMEEAARRVEAKGLGIVTSLPDTEISRYKHTLGTRQDMLVTNIFLYENNASQQ